MLAHRGPHVASIATAIRFRLPRCVLFDADGTLLNSLPAHVEFCRTLNDERALGLACPPRPTSRRRAKSPARRWRNSSCNAGFPDDVVPACVAEYEARFAAECPVVPYDGVDTLLRRVRDEIGAAAIVTSNTAVNVRRGLGPNLGADLEIFGIDNGPTTKREAIALALDRLGVAAPDDATYVGDTRSDFEAATACGLRFVGVDYVGARLAADVDELRQAQQRSRERTLGSSRRSRPRRTRVRRAVRAPLRAPTRANRARLDPTSLRSILANQLCDASHGDCERTPRQSYRTSRAPSAGFLSEEVAHADYTTHV